MLPKRSQEGHEAKAVSPRRPGRPQEVAFLAMVEDSGVNLEAKIEQKLQKIDENLVLAAFRRFGSFRVARGKRRDALGTGSGRQVGLSWPSSWPSWAPCCLSLTFSWWLATNQRPLRTIPEPPSNVFVSSNSVPVDFSLFFGTCMESPNLNFRQPLQCLVDFGGVLLLSMTIS